MSIREYITEHFQKKITEAPALLVYDASGHYRELVAGLGSDKVHVVDAGQSFIIARERAQGDFYPGASPRGAGPARFVPAIPGAHRQPDQNPGPLLHLRAGGRPLPERAPPTGTLNFAKGATRARKQESIRSLPTVRLPSKPSMPWDRATRMLCCRRSRAVNQTPKSSSG
jgi:hypothetical protein